MSFPVPGPTSPSSGFTDVGVGGDHVLHDPKEKYRKPKSSQMGSYYSSPWTKQPEARPGDGWARGV